jgi:DNA (cytosine-5)-methyltransferase 1
LLENVPFMLQLDGGKAMAFLTATLKEHGYNWAYRVVDSRAFGLPQRRQRVLLLASRTEDPREILLVDEAGEQKEPDRTTLNGEACGFYWTEGVRGLGWAVNAIPTLKGGSTVGIPSPPAIVLPNREIVTPEIRDAERLQGFPADWTLPATPDSARRNGPRWKLVGNAVSVPVARWLGECLARPRAYGPLGDSLLPSGSRWPVAAWCMGGDIYEAHVSRWPKKYKRTPLVAFLKYPSKPLSARATAGFLLRTEKGSLRFPAGFLEAVDAHLSRMEREEERQ